MPAPADLTSQEHFFPYYHFIPLDQTMDIFDEVIGWMQKDIGAAMQTLRAQAAIERARALRPQPGVLTRAAALASVAPPPTTLLDLALKLGEARVLVSELRDMVAKPGATPMNPQASLAELQGSFARRIATLTSEIAHQRSTPMMAGGTAPQSAVKPGPSNALNAVRTSMLKNRF